MPASTEHMLFAGLAVLWAAAASYYDVRERRIPNRLTGGGLLAGLLLHLAVGGWPDFGMAALAAGLAGGVFMVFFIAGGMGAGDVKLMAAVGAIAGLAALQMLILSTVFAGAIFAVALASYHRKLGKTLSNVAALLAHHGQRGLQPHPELNVSNEQTLRLPFAIPIAAGCAAALTAVAWGARS